MMIENIGLIIGRNRFVGLCSASDYLAPPEYILRHLDALNINTYLSGAGIINDVEDVRFDRTIIIVVKSHPPYNGEVGKLKKIMDNSAARKTHPILFVPEIEGIEDVVNDYNLPFVVSQKPSENYYEMPNGKTAIFMPRKKDLPTYVGFSVEDGILKNASVRTKSSVVYEDIPLNISLHKNLK